MSRFSKALPLQHPVSLLLHNIRSVHNVGSIFRTALSAGVEKIYLSGFTPKPLDRFGRVRKDLSKVSLGSEKALSIESIDNPLSLLSNLKKEGVSVLALEQSSKAKNYREYLPKGPIILILGEEVKGIDQELLNVADEILEIPMRGIKESLNVSVAAGIALFHLSNL